MKGINETLMDQMAAHRLAQLVGALQAEFRLHYPKRCRILGMDALHAFCLRCAQDAVALGCENYGEMKGYALVAWHLGIGFARDPYLDPIGAIFTKSLPFGEQMEEVSALFFEKFYLANEESLHEYTDALSRLTDLDLKEIGSLTTYAQIAAILEMIYPRRVSDLGGIESVSTALALSCEGKTVRYGLHHPLGIFLFGALMFFLGSEVDSDPLYPWVSQTLGSAEAHATDTDMLMHVLRKRIQKELLSLNHILKEIDHG